MRNGEVGSIGMERRCGASVREMQAPVAGGEAPQRGVAPTVGGAVERNQGGGPVARPPFRNDVEGPGRDGRNVRRVKLKRRRPRKGHEEGQGKGDRKKTVSPRRHAKSLRSCPF